MSLYSRPLPDQKAIEQSQKQLEIAKQREVQALAVADHLESRNSRRLSEIEKLAGSLFGRLQMLEDNAKAELLAVFGSWRQELEVCSERIRSVHQKLDSLVNVEFALNTNTASLQDMATHLDHRISQSQDKLDELVRDIGSYTVKKSALEKEVSAFEVARDTASAEFEALEQTMGSRIADLTKQVVESQRELTTMLAKVDETNALVEVAEKQLQDTIVEDQQHREQWATMTLELDKREQVLAKREQKLISEEHRVKAREDWMKL